MSKLTRVLQKLFGSTAGPTEIGQFGSYAAGSPTFTTNPATIQALGNFLQGWFGASVGGNSPAQEDMNALFFLAFRQLAYIFQAGVPEWDAATTYYVGSVVQSGFGLSYWSVQNNNVGHPLADVAWWRPAFSGAGFAAIVGSHPFCTHADFNAVCADANISTYSKILVADNLAIASDQTINKFGLEFVSFIPQVVLSGTTAKIIVDTGSVTFRALRFQNFNTALQFTVNGVYCRVAECDFDASVTVGIDDSAAPAGTKPVVYGTHNIL